MIDVKFLRENPELVKAKVALKHFECDIDAVLALDAQRRKAVADFEDARAAQNAASKAMAELPKGSPEFKEKLAEMKEVSKRVKDLEAAAAEIDKRWKQILLTIPNMPDDSVPVGKSAEDNVTVYTWGDVAKIKNGEARQGPLGILPRRSAQERLPRAYVPDYGECGKRHSHRTAPRQRGANVPRRH